MKKGLAILEVGVGEKAERGVFRFHRDGCQVFACDAVVVKPFAVGRYRIVPFCEGGRHFWFKVERNSDFGFRNSDFGSGIGYVGDGGDGEVVVGGEVPEFAERYGLGYVALGYGYVDGVELSHRSVAVSELWQAMLLLPHCEFEVKESGVGDES